MSNVKKIEIKELDPDIIPPITSRMNDPNYNGGSKIVVVGKPGCFAPGTKVLMYDGTIKNVEDVVVGEKLMGDDSTPRNVLELCHNFDIMFNIIPDEGESYTVNENHILSLKHNDEIVDITVKDFLNMPLDYKRDCRWYRTSVDFTEKHCDVDPYLLGYCLGIGIEKMNSNSNFIVHAINKYNLKDKKGGIPFLYKTNSRYNRMELLAGIIDYDEFSYCSESNAYDIVNKNEVFIDDVIFLARSLGFFAQKTEFKYYENKNDQTKGSYFNCHIKGDLQSIPVHKSPEKILSSIIKDVLTTDFSIEMIEEGEYYGFVLDGNHRFLGADFSVLHNTGKSTVIKSILYAKKHIFPVGMAMSGSEDSNHCYSEFMPSTFVFNEYDEDKISQMIKRQKIAAAHLPNPWAFMILDDCTDDPRIFNRPLQQALYKKGRHWGLLYILSLQYAMDVKPVIRTNVDGIFILREPLLKNRESLYKNYASIIPDFTTFCELMDQLTEDYHCMFILGATNVNTWQECVFWYKAPLIPKGWKVGAPEYWDFHYARYNENYTDKVTGY
jgi:hypothetical protein